MRAGEGPDRSESHRPLVAISSCLLGERVRYDGEHRRSELIQREIGPHVEWVSICPEVGAGMGTPRPPIALVLSPGAEPGVRALEVESRRDWTTALEGWASAAVERLRDAGICGCVLKSRSPSCGVGSTPHRTEGGLERARGDGVFAAAIRWGLPGLPTVDDGQLVTPADCRTFLERVRSRSRTSL